MYAPLLGRFLSQDPLVRDPTLLSDSNWFGGRMTLMRNSYGYTGNQPTHFSDPTGLATWEGPPNTSGGTTFRVKVYYGPWKCEAGQFKKCQTTCKDNNKEFNGCIWVADIKVDITLPSGIAAGTRVGRNLCCCHDRCSDKAYAEARTAWDKFREQFRREVSQGPWGEFPKDNSGNPFPVHHIRDLRHGGNPTDPENLLPTPPDVHKQFNTAYNECYARAGEWSTPGPANTRPYTD